MSDTIREQIIAAIATRLSSILVTKGYNLNMGNNVFRAIKNVDPDNELPAIVIFPGVEEATKEYRKYQNIMPVVFEGMAKFGATNPSIIGEQILGDIIENIQGKTWTDSFTSGGTYETEVGDTITGAVSSATAYVETITISSGSFAGGDAAGTITYRRKSGTFGNENINVGANLNVMTLAGSQAYYEPIDLTTGGLASQIEYISGGITSYPEPGEMVVGSQAIFNIMYYTEIGNPYSQ